ncbi:MAG: sigma-70 family RNA polymerase sigma factor [Thiohalomonadales bacterium]
MNQKMTAIEKAWLEYKRQLLRFIRSKVETLEDAEDILNDVFLKLTKIANENALPDNISSWLYRVSRNRIIDYYRTKKTFDQLPDGLSSESEGANVIKQLSKCMLPMIQALPESYQQAVMLSEIGGKKYKEVSVELNLSVSAVKSRILRGREKLRKSLLRCCEIYRNDAGEVVDYAQNINNCCNDC